MEHPSAMAAARTPQKQSPAPVVSTTRAARPSAKVSRSFVTARAPAAPSVTMIVWSGRHISRRASGAASRAPGRLRGVGVKRKFALIDHEDVDERKQRPGLGHGRCGVEYLHARPSRGAGKQRCDRIQGCLELAEEDRAAGRVDRAHVFSRHRPIRAADHHDHVLAGGRDADVGLTARGVRQARDGRDIDASSFEVRDQPVTGFVLAHRPDQGGGGARCRGGHGLVGSLPPAKRSKLWATSVSPGAGRRATRQTLSRLIEPKTQMPMAHA